MPFVRKAPLPIAAIALLALALSFAVLAQSWGTDAGALCGGDRYALQGPPFGPAPTIQLAADGVEGAFLLDTGATQSSLSAEAFPGPEGSVRNASISLPSFERGNFLLVDADAPSRSGGRRLGVIGTDFMSLLSAQFSGGAVYLGDRPCEAKALRARGLVPVSEKGFFSSDPSTIGAGLANVPIVYLRVGEVRAWAQIDTGYADTVIPHSVDINEALYDRLVASGVRLERAADIGVLTCEGHESRRTYAVRDNALAIENERGQPIVETDSFRLIVKRANGCGGIGALTTPAAQLGASFLKLFGTIVLDPKSATVWLDDSARRSRAAPSIADSP
jgi:hypothetical protein